jgi:hypothetical protein
MTTTQDVNTCPECGESYGFPVPTRFYAMVSHMVNKGEITLAEARAEMATCIDRDTAAFLAGWVMDRADQDDAWRAGDPVRLSDGRVVAYADENMARVYPERLVRTGDETWGFDPDTDPDMIHPAI